MNFFIHTDLYNGKNAVYKKKKRRYFQQTFVDVNSSFLTYLRYSTVDELKRFGTVNK